MKQKIQNIIYAIQTSDAFFFFIISSAFLVVALIAHWFVSFFLWLPALGKTGALLLYYIVCYRVFDALTTTVTDHNQQGH